MSWLAFYTYYLFKKILTFGSPKRYNPERFSTSESKKKIMILKKTRGPSEMAISPSLKAAQNWACVFTANFMGMLQEVFDIVMT